MWRSAALVLAVASVLSVTALPVDASVRLADGSAYDRTAADQNKPITPDEALTRGEDWIRLGLGYSQDANHSDRHGTPYRTDCSGFVSMAWHTDSPGFSTLSLEAVSHPIGWQEIQPGDALNSFGHVAMVVKWHPGLGADVMTFGETPPQHSFYSVVLLAMGGYYPLRYDRMRIVTDAMVLDEVRRRVQRPDVFVQPPYGRTLVNLDTIFYADDTPYHAIVPMADGTVNVEIWASPTWFAWDYGDGKTDGTPDGGAPFPDETITHRYETADTFQTSVDVTWGEIRWQIVGDDEVHVVNQTLTLQGEDVALTAIESQALLRGDERER